MAINEKVCLMLLQAIPEQGAFLEMLTRLSALGFFFHVDVELFQ